MAIAKAILKFLINLPIIKPATTATKNATCCLVGLNIFKIWYKHNSKCDFRYKL
jgi:hypothetical protein